MERQEFRYFLVTLFCVAYVLSKMNVSSVSTFRISKFHTCPAPDSKLHSLVDISLDECVEECTYRPNCTAVGYKRLYRLCEVYVQETSPPITDKHCVMVLLEDMGGQQSKIKCDDSNTLNGKPGECSRTTCRDFLVTNGDLKGSGNTVGSVRTIRCHCGYKEINDMTNTQCQSTGVWDYYPECRPIVCMNITLMNGELIGAGYKVGAVRKIACNGGYQERSGATTIQCEGSGNWSYIPACDINNACSTHIRDQSEHYDDNDDNTFKIKISNRKEKWDNARDCCEEDNGRLVIIDTHNKMNFVKELLENGTEYKDHSHDYWTDGREKNSQWLFSDNSTVPMNEGAFWMEGTPNGKSNKECARLMKKNGRYLWNDKSCSKEYRFICQYDFQ